MNQNIFVKEDIIPGTQDLEGYRVVVHNPDNRQYGSWYTGNKNACEIDTDFGADPYRLEDSLIRKQGYNKVDLNFILGDRFQYAAEHKVVINTTRRITNLMQTLIEDTRNKLASDVGALKREHILPELEGDERKTARFNLAKALENWFEEKISDTHNIWFDFLRETLGYVDWILVAQWLDGVQWRYEPKWDTICYDYYTNSLTWTVVHFIESNGYHEIPSDVSFVKPPSNFPAVGRLIKQHLEQKTEIDALADQLHDWFIKKLPYSVTSRTVNSQIVLAGIQCVDWRNVARSLLPDEN